MSVNRLILLALILGGLILFFVQNWSIFPSISIVLLGMRVRTLPLAAWILFSLLAGAATSLLINSLLQLSGYISQARNSRQYSETRYSRYKNTSTDFKEGRNSRYTDSPPQRKPFADNSGEYRNYVDNREYDDEDSWENPRDADDWGFKEDRSNSSTQNNPDTGKFENHQPSRSKRTKDKESDWETEPELDPELDLELDLEPELDPEPENPRNSSSDSDTSYGYKQPQTPRNSVKKSIYDADYRVIDPPLESSNVFQDENQSNNSEDDWSFLEDDDFEVDKNSPSST
ncbi:MAG: hypothetical protein AAF208_01805 [Cyanobacteria bacterium P01_A01_bin.45]